jgi:hypothetical protein
VSDWRKRKRGVRAGTSSYTLPTAHSRNTNHVATAPPAWVRALSPPLIPSPVSRASLLMSVIEEPTRWDQDEQGSRELPRARARVLRVLAQRGGLWGSRLPAGSVPALRAGAKTKGQARPAQGSRSPTLLQRPPLFCPPALTLGWPTATTSVRPPSQHHMHRRVWLVTAATAGAPASPAPDPRPPALPPSPLRPSPLPSVH